MVLRPSKSMRSDSRFPYTSLCLSGIEFRSTCTARGRREPAPSWPDLQRESHDEDRPHVAGRAGGTEAAGARRCASQGGGLRLRGRQRHHSPWLVEQGHSPYTWSVLGAVAHATERIDLMTYVTCPTIRYHPTVVAQNATRKSDV